MKTRKIIAILAAGVLCGCTAADFSTLDNEQPAVEQKMDENMKQKDPTPATKKIVATAPIEGDVVGILKTRVQSYIDAMHEQAENIPSNYDDYSIHDFYVMGDGNSTYGKVFENSTDKVKIDDYYLQNETLQKSRKVSLVFDATGFEENTTFTVKYSLKSDLSDYIAVQTTSNHVEIENLFSGKTYYWQVTSGETSSEINTFKTKEGFRMISCGPVNNVRDMGGRPVKGGKRIKQGQIFRGSELVGEEYTNSSGTHGQSLNSVSRKVLADDLGIKVEYDLRGDTEANNQTESDLKDEQHPDIEYHRIDNIMAYKYIIAKSSSDERWPLVREMFLAFRDSATKPVYFHCWGGADRTGSVAFLLGGLLGMSYTDLIIDFELTSFSTNFRPHYKNDSNKIYTFPELIYELYTNSMFEASDDIATRIEKLLIAKAGMNHEEITQIRDALLED